MMFAEMYYIVIQFLLGFMSVRKVRMAENVYKIV